MSEKDDIVFRIGDEIVKDLSQLPSAVFRVAKVGGEEAPSVPVEEDKASFGPPSAASRSANAPTLEERVAALEAVLVKREENVPSSDPVLDVFLRGPSKPRVPVIFTTSDAVHRAYFHHLSIRGRSLLLFYDDRYDEGHRYMPLPTPEGQSIRITVPPVGESGEEKTYEAVVLDLSNTFGPIDIVQLFLLRECVFAAAENA